MKTHKYLFPQITTFRNLLIAAKKAQKGKKYKPDVDRFHFRLEEELFRLQKELTTKTYRPGNYRTFFIHDPKKRMISAAPYRDRVVHHALCNIIEPIFERSFLFDSYANRKGKGVHAAIERFQYYARKYPYVLKCDIRKFFPSLDHEILKQELRRKIACPDTLWLIDLIIDHSNPQEEHIVYFPGDDLFTPAQRRRGLPIGNLTSQFWANVYLNRFDHFVREKLRAPGYIRYVDDFVLFGDDKEKLNHWKEELSRYLAGLRLIPHEHKTQIHRVKDGVPFLGFRVYPYHRVVKKQTTRRHKRFLRKKIARMRQGELTPDQLESGLNSWLGHIRFGQSKRLEYQFYWYICFSGVNLLKHPRGSWRVLELPFRKLSGGLPQQEQCR